MKVDIPYTGSCTIKSLENSNIGNRHIVQQYNTNHLINTVRLAKTISRFQLMYQNYLYKILTIPFFFMQLSQTTSGPTKWRFCGVPQHRIFFYRLYFNIKQKKNTLCVPKRFSYTVTYRNF